MLPRLIIAGVSTWLWTCLGGPMIAAAAPVEQRATPTEFRDSFRDLCDRACDRLNRPERRVPFYHDSYAVRALGVAFDETNQQKYLDVCRAWSDRMLDFQKGMSPAGAYYMNYGRKPGEQTGSWYVADGSCIALAVLMTAVRCPDQTDRARYLASVESFAQLVTSRYTRPSGGITNGLWPKFDGEWWCSTGPFAALAFGLHAETGKSEYLQTGLRAIAWLNDVDIHTVGPYPLKEQGPSMIMYLSEAYSAAWPFLKANEPAHTKALRQNAALREWASANQGSAGKISRWDYHSQWGSKFGGLPLHAYVSADLAGGGTRLLESADEELRYLDRQIKGKKGPDLSQLEAFTLISYAERVRPGAVYGTNRPRASTRRAD